MRWGMDAACLFHASVYADGKLIPPDYETAEAILSGDCARGSAASCYGYAMLYYEGEMFPKDLPLAVEILERAFALDTADGCWRLGLSLDLGKTGDRTRSAPARCSINPANLALGMDVIRPL